jgi:hypothetical protein
MAKVKNWSNRLLTIYDAIKRVKVAQGGKFHEYRTTSLLADYLGGCFYFQHFRIDGNYNST